MIRSLLVVFATLSTTVLWAQDDNIVGKVVYDYYVDTALANKNIERLRLEKPATYAQYGAQFIRTTKVKDELKFVLRFDMHRASFSVDDQARPDRHDEFEYKTAKTIATDARDVYYLDRRTRYRVSRAELNGSSINILEPFEKHQWTLTGNEKCVAGRTLLEATTTREISGPGGQTDQAVVVAWYAPDMPFAYGPLGFDGLPGLIIELRFGPKFSTGFTAVIVEIERATKRSQKISKPKAVAELTEGEFQRRAKERWEAVKNSGG